MLAAGDPAAAESAYRRALEIAPESASAWTGLGCALDTRSDEAEVAFRKALALAPGHAGTVSRLAHRLREHGHAREAIHELRSALLANPDDGLLLRTLGEILVGVGDPEAACAAYRRALANAPDDWSVWGMLLWALNFVPEAGAGQILAEHRRFGDAMALAVGPTLGTPVRHEHRRLKVGYVSADFRGHPVSCFIEPLLRHHDRNRFEVHCFYTFPGRDVITERVSGLA
ncbi:MAG TPA: tetratricopeptide repeat protein, partial [Rhodanobacteraceae bacterium]|nr:tetratricopeptide repeat protein [Rhodanobacteraceae bacterium]